MIDDQIIKIRDKKMKVESFFEKRDFCPVCHSELVKDFYSISYNDQKVIDYLIDFYQSQGEIDVDLLKDEEYVLVKCSNCDLVYQKYVPNNKLLFLLYEKWINPDFAFERSKTFSIDERLSMLNEILNVIRYFDISANELKFFDFGMGWANYCVMVKSLGIDSYGSELSIERIKNARKSGIKVVSWEEIPSMKFHYINTDDVFEHLTNPAEVFEYLIKSLLPGGVIKINVPNGTTANDVLKMMDWSAKRGTKYNVNIVSPLEHLNCFYPKSIRMIATINGLKEIKIRQNCFAKTSDSKLINKVKRVYRSWFLGIKPTVLFFRLE